MEVSAEKNFEMVKAFNTIMGEVLTQFNAIFNALQSAKHRGDEFEIQRLSLAALEAYFAIVSLRKRSLCYERGVNDPAFMKQFWLNLLIN